MDDDDDDDDDDERECAVTYDTYGQYAMGACGEGTQVESAVKVAVGRARESGVAGVVVLAGEVEHGGRGVEVADAMA